MPQNKIAVTVLAVTTLSAIMSGFTPEAQAGVIMPLEVWFEEVNTNFQPCSNSPPFGIEHFSCSLEIGAPPGFNTCLPGKVSGVISWDGPHVDGSQKLGEFGPGSFFDLPHLGTSGLGYGGFGCDSTLDNFVSISSGNIFPNPFVQIRVVNPNPFPVTVAAVAEKFAYADCSSRYPDSGFGDFPGTSRSSSLPAPFVAELSQLCQFNGRFTNGVPHSMFNFVVPASSSSSINLHADGQAEGHSEIFDFQPPIAIINSGYGVFSSLSALRLAIAGDGVPPLNEGVYLLEVTGASPINLLLTDEQGRRVGIDPDLVDVDPGPSVDSQQLPRPLAEIPGSSYSGPGTEPQEIAIGLPALSSSYDLSIFGTGNGPYAVTVQTLALDGSIISQETILGEASEGSTQSQEFTVGSDGDVAVLPGVDSDGDGVPDDVDQCPNEPGPRENNGCPVPPRPETPVGGEILSIHTTSLFIAGAFTNAYWILPMIAGIAGAVLVTVRAAKQKTEEE